MITEIARAKVNLALHVLGRREDGCHELDSLVVFAELGDRLSLEPAACLELAVEGPFAAELPCGEDNLAMRAARALGNAVVPARIVLHKLLPIASGLGGGSADAAAVLRALPRLSGKCPAPEHLQELARNLGADVTVCLASKPCRMGGSGDRLSALDSLGPFHAVLANPSTPLATAEVFRALGLRRGAAGFPPIRERGALEECRNDLEAPAIRIVPAIARVLEALRSQDGVKFARMSGSGATCFGLFDDKASAARAAERMRPQHPGWWIAATILD